MAIVSHTSKPALLASGRKLIADFCDANGISCPDIVTYDVEDWMFSVCAYYRNNKIHICLPKCAHVGTANRAWSWPGYITDRTPYGVLAHELGYHVDVTLGSAREEEEPLNGYSSTYSAACRERSKEPKLTSYCPNNAEWFAEMFRLFVTNPNLLKYVRPSTYEVFLQEKLHVVETRSWREVLEGAPERTIEQAQNKIHPMFK